LLTIHAKARIPVLLMLRIVLVACLLAGCKKSAGTCEKSVDSVLDRAVSADGGGDQVPEAIVQMTRRMGDALAKLCTDDGWSPDVLACLDDANDTAAAKACANKLTPAQHKKLDKTMGEVMGLPIVEKK
jgi:hypothetical protein